MRELLDALAEAPDQPRIFPQIEDAMEWPHRRIASVLGGVSHLRHTEFGGPRPYRFQDEHRSASGRWEMWMDAAQARAVHAAGAPKPASVGKTTTGRILAARSERAVHVESDLFFHFIRSGYIEPWKPESREQNTVVMRVVADAAGTYAAAGSFTIVDGIILPVGSPHGYVTGSVTRDNRRLRRPQGTAVSLCVEGS